MSGRGSEDGEAEGATESDEEAEERKPDERCLERAARANEAAELAERLRTPPAADPGVGATEASAASACRSRGSARLGDTKSVPTAMASMT